MNWSPELNRSRRTISPPFRIIFKVINDTHTNLHNNSKIRITIKAMIDNIGQSVLVLALLSLGTLSIAHPQPQTEPNGNIQRTNYPTSGIGNCNSPCKDKNRILKQTLPGTEYLIPPHDRVDLYGERLKLSDGSFKVSDKIISVTDGNKAKYFNITALITKAPSESYKYLKTIWVKWKDNT